MGRQALLGIAALLAVGALAASLCLKYNSGFGLGIAPDSISYLSVAQHIAAGKGVQVFMSNYSDRSYPIAAWPPFYPLIIAVFIKLRLDMFTAVLWIQSVLFGLNVALTGYLIGKYSRNWFWAAGGAALAGTDVAFHHYHSWILTEPLFVLLINGAILFNWNFLATEKRGWGWLTAACLGLATVTRYMGFAYVFAFGASVLLFGSGRFHRRIFKAALWTLAAALPFLAWTARNIIMTHKEGQPAVQSAYGSLIHRYETDVFRTVGQSLSDTARLTVEWIQSLIGSHWAAAGALIIFLGLGIASCLYRVRTEPKTHPNAAILPGLLVLYAVTYVAALAAFLRFTHFTVPVPQRYIITYLSHVYVAGFLLAGAFLGLLGSRGKLGCVVVCVLLAAGTAAFIPYRTAALREWSSKLYWVGADESSGARQKFARAIRWIPG